MMIARWTCEAKFGRKGEALALLNEWNEQIGAQTDLDMTKSRTLTGSVGDKESVIQNEIDIENLAELDAFFDKIASIEMHAEWGKNFGGKDGRGIQGTPIIVSAKNAFHGRGLGSTTMMDDKTSRKDLEPLLPGFEHIPFNDIEALETKLRENNGDVAGVFLEPIQAEAGIFVPDDGYLKKVQELTKEYGTDILISATTKDGLDQEFAMEALPATMVKGRKTPVEIFKVV